MFLCQNEEPGTRKDPEPEITPEVNTRRMTRSQTKSPAATSTSSKMPPTRGGRTRSAASKSPLPMGSQKRSSRPEGDDKESGSQKKVATRRTSARVATKSSERSESEEIQIGSKTETLDQQQERPTPPTQSRSDDKTPDGVCDTAKEEKMSVSLSSNDSPEPPDDDVIMRSPPNKKGVRRAALFDSDTDEEEKKGKTGNDVVFLALNLRNTSHCNMSLKITTFSCHNNRYFSTCYYSGCFW